MGLISPWLRHSSTSPRNSSDRRVRCVDAEGARTVRAAHPTLLCKLVIGMLQVRDANVSLAPVYVSTRWLSDFPQAVGTRRYNVMDRRILMPSTLPTTTACSLSFSKLPQYRANSASRRDS